jgi:hypothetical protein
MVTIKHTRVSDDDVFVKEWEHVRALIIDEISFFCEQDMNNLDNKLKRLKGTPDDKLFGGVSIILSGDFHQLQPVAAAHDSLYSSTNNAIWRANKINVPIFLTTSHHFKDDPVLREILERMRHGQDTMEDSMKINTQLVGTNGLQLPNTQDTCFACCPTNKQRNAITAAIFKNHILDTHPDVDSDKLPPDHTLMVEAHMTKNKAS